MIDNAAIQGWLERYLTAWTTDAPEDIAVLFADGARYFSAPYREPCVGVDEIVKWWVAQKNSTIPWTFVYDVVAQDGAEFVVRGVTSYPEGLEEPGKSACYRNLWLITLDAEGRATEFEEYWMLEE